MASVALIGPDGAGKTTITQRLVGSGVLPFKYLYMGVSVSSSNTALFTSRMAERLKQRPHRTAALGTPGHVTARRPARGLRRGVRAAGRLCNRLADAWFRQLISWYYQRRGRVMLYDRHYVLDYAPEITITAGSPDTVERRLHRWCLARICPSPDLVIFLDAPGEVLFARKGELSVRELERRRQSFLQVGRRLRNFVCVDATRPLDVVYQDVVEQIVRFYGRPQDGALGPVQGPVLGPAHPPAADA